MCTHNLCFEKNKKSTKKIHLKITIFMAVKNPSILHSHVIVMVHPKNDNLTIYKQNLQLVCLTPNHSNELMK